jgi:hypothetical protein
MPLKNNLANEESKELVVPDSVKRVAYKPPVKTLKKNASEAVIAISPTKKTVERPMTARPAAGLGVKAAIKVIAAEKEP